MSHMLFILIYTGWSENRAPSNVMLQQVQHLVFPIQIVILGYFGGHSTIIRPKLPGLVFQGTWCADFHFGSIKLPAVIL